MRNPPARRRSIASRSELGLSTENAEQQQPEVQHSQEVHRRRLQTDMVRGSLWTAVASLTTLPVTLLVNVVVARSLGADGLGRLGTFVAGYALVSALVNMGWSEATVQWLAAARARGKRADEVGLVRSCTGYHCLVEGPLLAVITLLVLWQSGPVPAVIAAAAIWLTQALGTSTVIMTATARNAFSARLALVINMAGLAATASVASTTHLPAGTWAAQVTVAAFAPLYAFVRLDPWLRRAMLRPRLTLRAPHGFFVYAVSACASGLVATLVWGRSELFVLRAHGLVAAAGVFVIITGLAGQITVPMDSLMGPLTPTAAGLVASEPSLARDAMRRALRVSALLGALTASVAVPATFLLLVPLYGKSFGTGRSALLALVLVSCLQSVAGPLTSFAFAMRSAPTVLRNNVVCLLVDAALAIGLVPLIGLWGAVLASVTSQTLNLILLARVVQVRMDVSLGNLAVCSRVFLPGAMSGSLAVSICALVPVPLPGQLALVVLGPAVLVMCLYCVPALRLTAGDGSAIVKSLPRWLGRAAARLMSRLYLVESIAR